MCGVKLGLLGLGLTFLSAYCAFGALRTFPIGRAALSKARLMIQQLVR
jgi:hypothetical protein